eukprot:6212298-Pleurochrysis_carterae.AAC.1
MPLLPLVPLCVPEAGRARARPPRRVRLSRSASSPEPPPPPLAAILRASRACRLPCTRRSDPAAQRARARARAARPTRRGRGRGRSLARGSPAQRGSGPRTLAHTLSHLYPLHGP